MVPCEENNNELLSIKIGPYPNKYLCILVPATLWYLIYTNFLQKINSIDAIWIKFALYLMKI